MKEEIAAAVFFVTRLAKRYGSLDNQGRDRLAATLTSVLFEKYKNHWDPEAPSKGQAYRCLRMNRLHHRDPVLELACIRSMVRYEDLGLPGELTLWVDPGEVSCRYGERTVPFCVSLVETTSSNNNHRRRADAEFSRRIQSAVDRAFAEVPSGSSSDEEDCGSSGSSCSRDTSLLSSSRDTSMVSSSRDTSMVSSRDTSLLSSSRDTSMVSLAGSSSSSGGSGGSLSPPRSSSSMPARPQTIPTVSNPNSVYKMTEFSSGGHQSWAGSSSSSYPKRKPFASGGPAGGGEGFPSHPPPPPPAFSGGSQQHQHQHGGSYRPYVRPSFIFSGPRVDKYHWVSKTRS